MWATLNCMTVASATVQGMNQLLFKGVRFCWKWRGVVGWQFACSTQTVFCHMFCWINNSGKSKWQVGTSDSTFITERGDNYFNMAVLLNHWCLCHPYCNQEYPPMPLSQCFLRGKVEMEDINWITTYNSFYVLSRVAGGFTTRQACTHHVCTHINSSTDHVRSCAYNYRSLTEQRRSQAWWNNITKKRVYC